MQLHYHKALGGNFGDDLNEWIWDELTPDLANIGSEDDVLVGMGSILHGDRLRPYKSEIAIMGSGYNLGSTIDEETYKRCRFYAVRGPYTKRQFDLTDSVAMLDPGSLMPDLQPPSQVSHQRVLFIPHHKNMLEKAHQFPLDDIVKEAGFELLSPGLDSRFVLEKISGASLVVSESLHGLIVADAYRVPWIAVKFGPRVTPYKFRDWGASLDVDIDFIDLFPGLNFISRLERKVSRHLGVKGQSLDWRKHLDHFGGYISSKLIKSLQAAAKSRPTLSRDDILNQRKAHFYGALEKLKKDFS